MAQVAPIRLIIDGISAKYAYCGVIARLSETFHRIDLENLIEKS